MKHEGFGRGGLTAWVDDQGRLFAVGGDGVLREYRDEPGMVDLFSADLDRVPFGAPRVPAELLSPLGERLRPPPAEELTLAAEWRVTLVVLLAAIVTGTAIAALVDAAGTAAIVADLVRWWLL